jgi:hypothetical protein
MIGVLCRNQDQAVAAEFFELFKTPWAPYDSDENYAVVIVDSVECNPSDIAADLVLVFGSDAPPAGQGPVIARSPAGDLPLLGSVRLVEGDGEALVELETGAVCRRIAPNVVRCGYELLGEVRRILTEGQPVSVALYPTLELHIALVRRWILEAGVRLVEIPPIPSGYEHIACLTHDVDNIGIRLHRGDHTLWGFVFRASVGSVRDVLRGRSDWRRLAANLRALATLPFVFLGVAEDYWLDFDEYAEIERELGATFFFIPRRGYAGKQVAARHARRRAAPYDLDDARPWIARLHDDGFEIGVHGLDAWIDAEDGAGELERIANLAGSAELGIRMHWLCFDEGSWARLDEAGYVYDATFGYNDAVGFRAGTHQVFRPLSATRLLELPLHIQDTSLFLSSRLGLREARAIADCSVVTDSAREHGGVVTLSWHSRSCGPERLWGGFYRRLIAAIRQSAVWFAPARDVVAWFATRRDVTFRLGAGGRVQAALAAKCEERLPPFLVRVHLGPNVYRDVVWRTGDALMVEVEPKAEVV